MSFRAPASSRLDNRTPAGKHGQRSEYEWQSSSRGLWGVGSTAPYLHDGRATTLTEAILAHGGESNDSREAFEALSVAAQKDLIAFLENLVLFKMEEQAPQVGEGAAGAGGGAPAGF